MAPKVPFLGLETEALHLINSITLTDFGLIVHCRSGIRACA
jgi:hypothetical protein